MRKRADLPIVEGDIVLNRGVSCPKGHAGPIATGATGVKRLRRAAHGKWTKQNAVSINVSGGLPRGNQGEKGWVGVGGGTHVAMLCGARGAEPSGGGRHRRAVMDGSRRGG